MAICVCKSGKSYENCCKIFHDGALPKTALELMRSRYSAYALQKPDYIMKTTHPCNPYFKQDQKAWRNEILFFCQNTQFVDLTILEFIEGEEKSSVTFLAKLNRKGQDASFIEKSAFEKVNGRWLYKDGVLSVSKPSS